MVFVFSIENYVFPILIDRLAYFTSKKGIKNNRINILKKIQPMTLRVSKYTIDVSANKFYV